MCRIAGIYNNEGTNTHEIALLETALIEMYHGGPDDTGIFKTEQLVLGHNRLSILDLSSSGKQPMHWLQKFVISFNGEIYNYREIKEQLQATGYYFETCTDTEVILAAYNKWGTDCFRRFNGMFAFCLFDKVLNKLFLVRDMNGIKPLYYLKKQGKLYFSSETRVFPGMIPDLRENKDWPVYLLSFGSMPEPYTSYEGVLSLPKGHYMELYLATGQTKIHHFASFNFEKTTINSRQEAVIYIREYLDKAVKLQMHADAPIATLLSGGIDSSIITLLAAKEANNLHTLSINFDDARFSEYPYQASIIKKIKKNHHFLTLTKDDFLQNYQDILRAMDQPSIDGINTYFIGKFSKEIGITTIVSGLGADELFGGYPSFFNRNQSAMGQMLPNVALDMIEKTFPFKYKKLAYLKMNDENGRYLFNRGVFSPRYIASILGTTEEEVWSSIQNFRINEVTANMDSFQKSSWMELNQFMLNQLLRDSDFMSMWHSIELRVPFLDQEFMQIVMQISSRLKETKSRPKDLLIEAFRNELPREIWDRPKRGFTLPLQTWIKDIPELKKLGNEGNKIEKEITSMFYADQIEWPRIWALLLMKNRQNKMPPAKKSIKKTNKLKDYYSVLA